MMGLWMLLCWAWILYAQGHLEVDYINDLDLNSVSHPFLLHRFPHKSIVQIADEYLSMVV